MKKIYVVFSILWLISLIFIIKLKTKNPQQINENTANFKSLEADIYMEIGEYIFKKKYSGKLVYLKPNNVFLILESKKESIEVGSNQDHFWYYSTYEDVLCYGLVENVNYILKEMFSPYTIVKVFFPNITTKKGIEEDVLVGDYGEKLKRKIFVEDFKVTRQEIFNEKNETIFTVDVLEYYDKIPTKMLISYVKENTNIYIKIEKINLNKVNFDFILPLKKYKKNQFLTP